jgi:N-acetylglucosaminyldiphosphoundecaprenol N-acetyl-beta-D-mannosaminyltransferase
MNHHQRIDILGVPVDAVDMNSSLQRIDAMLDSERPHTIVAVNPEKVIAAHKNHPLLRALRNADLLIPDGIGVVLAARMLEKARLSRVPGSELMPEICSLAAKRGRSVFLFGAKPEVVTRVSEVLRARYPRLKIAGTQHGYVLEESMESLIGTINQSGAAVLFVATGSPRQELWIDQFRHRLSVRVIQGVGGTFDAICGNVRRAPKVLRKLHLEWLYRLLSQPQRAHRQKALPIFASKVIRELVMKKK